MIALDRMVGFIYGKSMAGFFCRRIFCASQHFCIDTAVGPFMMGTAVPANVEPRPQRLHVRQGLLPERITGGLDLAALRAGGGRHRRTRCRPWVAPDNCVS